MADELKWDESQLPIAIMRFPDGTITKALMEACLNHLIDMVTREKPFVVIIFHEATGAALNNEALAAASAFNKKYKDFTRKYLKGFCVVCSSMVARTAIMAIDWFSPFPYPAKAFKSEKDALAWARTRLEG